MRTVIRMGANLEEKYDLLRCLLIEARTTADLKQADVAEMLGRPQSYVSKIERGERGVDVIEFIEITRAIGCDPIKLLKKLADK